MNISNVIDNLPSFCICQTSLRNEKVSTVNMKLSFFALQKLLRMASLCQVCCVIVTNLLGSNAFSDSSLGP